MNISPTWDDLRVLLALHRERSFLSAAKALGVSTSTAARRIEALEGALGRALVHRTSAGTMLLPEALELVALAEEVEHRLSSIGREGERALEGKVRISMGEGFVRPLVSALAQLRRRHPEIQIELIAEARQADLARREADLGIRTRTSSSSVLVERRLGVVRFGLYAGTAYVERRLAAPRLRAGEFARHDFLGFEGALSRLPQHAWLVAQGATRFSFRSNSDAALLEAAITHQGIVLLAETVARDEPALVALAVDVPLPSVPVFLVAHRETKKVPRVRVVAAAIEEAIKARLG